MKNNKFMAFFNQYKAWLYLLPALILLGVFLIYPLIDVFIYSFEEDYNFVSETYSGIGFHNYTKVFTDPFFSDAVKNTFVIVIITVPLSTLIALGIAVGLNSIKPLQKFFQTVFFLPYVTNTIAIGLVFMLIFDYSVYSKGFANTFLGFFGIDPVDFIDGPHWAKMFVICFYITWSVMPFKIIVLIGALQGVKKDYYDAAKIDQASKGTIFRRITVPLISPYIAYLIITGFIGAFKQYNDCVALFGTNLDEQGMNTIVGYVYNMLYDETGGYPSYASAAAIILFFIVLTITCVNLYVNRKLVRY